jgi:hypothetical protein
MKALNGDVYLEEDIPDGDACITKVVIGIEFQV